MLVPAEIEAFVDAEIEDGLIIEREKVLLMAHHLNTDGVSAIDAFLDSGEGLFDSEQLEESKQFVDRFKEWRDLALTPRGPIGITGYDVRAFVDATQPRQATEHELTSMYEVLSGMLKAYDTPGGLEGAFERAARSGQPDQEEFAKEGRQIWHELEQWVLARRPTLQPHREKAQARAQNVKRKVGIKDPSVKNYMDFITDMTRGITGDGAASNQGANELYAARDWAESCRIVEVPPEMYIALYEGIDRYTTEALAGQDFQPARKRQVRGPDGQIFEETYYDQEPPSDEEAMHLVSTIQAEGRKMGWPEHWPFENTWLSFGHGVWLAPHQIEMRFPSQMAREQGWTHGRLVAMLVRRGGQCVEVLRLAKRVDERGWHNEWAEAWQLIPQYQGGRWLEPYGALAPWVMSAISAVIQDHRTVVLEHEKTGMSYKKACAAAKKKVKWPFKPKPFYRIQMKQRVEWERRVRQQFAKPIEIERQHRWDVREHERVRVRRGPLPLNEKTKKDLLRQRRVSRRCYKIYIDEPLDDGDAHRLSLRGFPRFKQGEEWLAILVTTVGEHVKGPADKPYIQGKRVLDPAVIEDGLE